MDFVDPDPGAPVAGLEVVFINDMQIAAEEIRLEFLDDLSSRSGGSNSTTWAML